MASSAAFSLPCLLPLSSASRPKTRRNARKAPATVKLSNPNTALKSLRPPPHRSAGDEATTYTRLPPKDDFSLPPSLSLPGEIKLYESPVAAGTATPSKDPIFPDEIADQDEEDEKEEFLDVDFDSDDEEEEEEIINRLGFEYGTLGLAEDTDANEDEFEEDGELDVKEKGLPAVMRCFDRAKIYVSAGDGGNGVVAFRREKFVPYGGPSGGDGGRGGDVYVEVDGSMNSLLPFRKAVHFRAGRGSHGQGKMMAGAKGEDVVVKVAPGTLIREARKGEEGEVLLELVHPGQRAMLLPGGRGGRGNAAFKSGTNKVPKIAEKGEKGTEM